MNKSIVIKCALDLFEEIREIAELNELDLHSDALGLSIDAMDVIVDSLYQYCINLKGE